MNKGNQKDSNRWFLIFALWVPLGLTLALTFMAFQGQHSHHLDSWWILNTAKMKDQLKNLNSLVQDIETSQAGYLLTGDVAYLALYEKASKEIPVQSESLAWLVAENPRQVAAVVHLQKLIGDKLSIAGESLALGQQQKSTDALQRARVGRAKSLAREIRLQVDDIEAEENRLFYARQKAFAAQMRIQRLIMTGLVSLDILLVLGVTLSMRHLQKARQKAEEQAQQAEAKSRQGILASELRYRRLFETAQDGILILDAESGQVLDANPFMEDLLGYSQKEFLERKLWEMGSLKGANALKNAFSGLQHTDRLRFEDLPLETKEGRLVEVEFISNAYLVDDKRLVQCNVRDLTQRKKSEQQLSLLKTCISNLNDIVLVTEADASGGYGSGVVFVNEAFERITGYSAAEAIGGSPGFLHGEKTDRGIVEEIRQAKESNQPIRRQLLYYKKDGTEFWLDIDIVPVFDPSGKCTHFAAIKRDITDRKRDEEQIEEQAAFLDKAQDAILVRDPAGTILFWNKGAERLYGWSRQEALGRNSVELYFPHPPQFQKINSQAMLKGEWNGELEHQAKDGHEITVEGRWTVIREEDGRPKSILEINTDITDKKNIESQFMRAQRMESIGTLAGGIAHDLNNILSPIMMSIELLKSNSSDPESKDILRTIEQGTKRGAEIVKQVLSFPRRVEGEKTEIQPQQLLNELDNIIKNTFPKDIHLRYSVPKDIWAISGDPTQVQQILLNLCVNARDAMPDGGDLTIVLENCVHDEKFVAKNIESKPGRFVHMTVTDTGTGMPPGVLDKIFEPFFTTKELHKGTGLGLSTVIAIVKSHEGTIQVESKPGKGTTFIVSLPAMEVSTVLKRVDKEQGILARGKGETILLVDDESSIVAITGQTLQNFGYRVLTARNGAEAVAVYAGHKEEIAVVLTDMLMPVMGGMAVIKALRRINPLVKIIAASGLASEEGVEKSLLAEATYFLAKPYTAETLLKTLRDILEEPHGGQKNGRKNHAAVLTV